jgi:hypothetical protein
VTRVYRDVTPSGRVVERFTAYVLPPSENFGRVTTP